MPAWRERERERNQGYCQNFDTNALANIANKGLNDRVRAHTHTHTHTHAAVGMLNILRYRAYSIQTVCGKANGIYLCATA